MADIIQLLPESLANQIAAGEVIQRPASAVKELMENAVDSGATDISVIIKDAGKSLIQVVDNGCGMSAADARMSFERHATSKIHHADDLFAIRTLGFRGEALASIAAIAQLEMRTRLHDQELGTCLIIEGSRVKSQNPCPCPAGTSIMVKNLFFNVPARRNFLKSNTAEFRHIHDEFIRVALIYKDIKFTLHHNNNQVFQLLSSNRKKRIVDIFGDAYSERLIPIIHETQDVNIHGFVGKPEFARKTRGEQFFFVNGRFIKHPYLHHAVENAFMELLPKDSFPSYFIFIELDPGSIDINIHPTKMEVNFLDARILYATLRSAIRQSLGQHNILPTIDFDVEKSLDFNTDPGKPLKNPFNRENSGYDPFEKTEMPVIKGPSFQRKMNLENWEKLYDIGKRDEESPVELPMDQDGESFEQNRMKSQLFQLHKKYIVTHIKSGILVIDQQKAHVRVLYEQLLEKLKNEQPVSQQELFPQNITLSSSDSDLLEDLKSDLALLGFSINKVARNTFVINGTPAGWSDPDLQSVFEQVLENFKKNLVDLNLDEKVNLARSIAVNTSIKAGKKLYAEEMSNLVDQLFACSVPEITPDGDRTFTILRSEEIDNLFKN